MSATILVVDDIPANVRLLQTKLEAEYYEVLTANDGERALALAAQSQPDLILLDVMMPGMDGYEVCRQLKAAPETRHIPIILLSTMDGRAERMSGIEAGADDFMTKPIDDVILFVRIKLLVRDKQMFDEQRQRDTLRGISPVGGALASREVSGNVLIVDDNVRQAERIMLQLGQEQRCAYESDPSKAMKIAAGRVDLIVLNLLATTFDALRWVAQLRSNVATRRTPVLGIGNQDDRSQFLKALELGVNDIIPRPVDMQELSARARTQIRRKRYGDGLLRGDAAAPEGGHNSKAELHNPEIGADVALVPVHAEAAPAARGTADFISQVVSRSADALKQDDTAQSFGEGEDGRLVATPSHMKLQADSISVTLYDELVKSFEAFDDKNQNQMGHRNHKLISDAKSALPSDIREVNPHALWPRINRLKIMLTKHNFAVADNEYGEERLDKNIIVDLEDIMSNWQLFVDNQNILRSKESVNNSELLQPETNEAFEKIQAAITDLVNDTDVTAETAKEMIKEAQSESVLSDEQPGNFPTANDARKSIVNFFRAALSKAGDAAKKLLSNLSDGVSKEMTKRIITWVFDHRAQIIDFAKIVLSKSGGVVGDLVDLIAKSFPTP